MCFFWPHLNRLTPSAKCWRSTTTSAPCCGAPLGTGGVRRRPWQAAGYGARPCVATAHGTEYPHVCTTLCCGIYNWSSFLDYWYKIISVVNQVVSGWISWRSLLRFHGFLWRRKKIWDFRSSALRSGSLGVSHGADAAPWQHRCDLSDGAAPTWEYLRKTDTLLEARGRRCPCAKERSPSIRIPSVNLCCVTLEGGDKRSVERIEIFEESMMTQSKLKQTSTRSELLKIGHWFNLCSRPRPLPWGWRGTSASTKALIGDFGSFPGADKLVRGAGFKSRLPNRRSEAVKKNSCQNYCRGTCNTTETPCVIICSAKKTWTWTQEKCKKYWPGEKVGGTEELLFAYNW